MPVNHGKAADRHPVRIFELQQLCDGQRNADAKPDHDRIEHYEIKGWRGQGFNGLGSLLSQDMDAVEKCDQTREQASHSHQSDLERNLQNVSRRIGSDRCGHDEEQAAGRAHTIKATGHRDENGGKGQHHHHDCWHEVAHDTKRVTGSHGERASH
jgi:hypothetical protein